ncbi:MAG: pyridoxamine 5'-phosphate oxidase family protein [Proteobacteria bacterium]|nr:pyridoxamine 5'-phosphate oxidase family protein [Pseudomonadota bacterium]
MTDFPNANDIVFTPAVRQAQERYGSRGKGASLEARGRFARPITEDVAAFIALRDSCYFGTASADGRPYIQHRGGPPGFLKLLDGHTIGFADFRGNRQYISAGNLSENDRAFLFLTDYTAQARVKLWGRARVVDDDPALIERLRMPGYDAVVERAIVFTIEAWDTNCDQHIPQLVHVDEVAQHLMTAKARIEALEADVARLKAQLTPPQP